MSRLALITGASSGIGATFARALAARGYDLVLVARRRERLDQLSAELAAAHGIRAEALPADLADDASRAAIEARIAAAEDLELLVNNAGFGAQGPVWEAELDRQDRMHRLHVLATTRLTHAALRNFVPRGRGAVINVSSVAGFLHSAGTASYTSTKSWMNSFTECVYLDLKAAGSPVKIQALCPGFTLSEFHDTAGMNRRLIPSWAWMKAEDVVAASLRGLERGDLFVVPGFKYRLVTWLVPALPRFLLHPLLLRYSGRRRLAH
jgi:short-subunit dehydrogenase